VGDSVTGSSQAPGWGVSQIAEGSYAKAKAEN